MSDAPQRRRSTRRGGNRRNPARASASVGTAPDQARLRARLAKAAAAREAVELPPITYPEQLPVSARRAEIAHAIAEHQVVIVAGETGSGKTTQLPKIALALGRGRTGQIGHTQPRRIAARTVAERIASELDVRLGTVVGYQVRFTDESSDQTLVKVMTDGILLAQIQRDPLLSAYDTLIIDEAHERSLNIDFLLGYLTELLPKRPELKVIITSATIDSQRFAEHFAIGGQPAPVIEVTGRTYPVEIRYRPLIADAGLPDATANDGRASGAPAQDRDLMTGIVDAVEELMRVGDGDILVFLAGEREIHDAADAIESHFGERTRNPQLPGYLEVLPLYSRLSAAEQHRVFHEHPGRRVVLATNVAETSLTVPGVRYVIDPGTARISRYSRATKVQRLPIEPISQASANQRSGRCGRVADGVAIRLYSRADFDSRPPFTEPEILRTSLASVILQMVAVGVVTTPAAVADFPFVDKPDTRAVRDGVSLLVELGALEAPGAPGQRVATAEADADAAAHARGSTTAGPGTAPSGPHGPANALTALGRQLAQLPMDPRLARMVIEAGRRDVLHDVIVIAAALSIQDVRERPAEERATADQYHGRFTDPTSDFLTYLNLWEYLREQQRALSGNQFRRTVRSEYLNYVRVREWQDLVAQLRELARPLTPVVAGGLSAVRHADRAAKIPPATAASGRTTQAASAGSGADRAAADGGDEPTYVRQWPADQIHQALLSGLLSQLGMQEATEVKASSIAHLRGSAREIALKRAKKQARNEYLGARGARFAIFPGSPLAKKPPVWIMAGELVETSRLWARDVARIEPEWAESIAPHLVKRTYSEPRWSRKRGAAVVSERVLLFGLPIVAGRATPYATIDQAAAREMFVRHALVDGEWNPNHAFWRHNEQVKASADELLAKARRSDLVLDDEAIFGFYDARIPAQVVSVATFERWWRATRPANPGLLDLSIEAVAPAAPEVDEALFPSHWPQGDMHLPLTYRFEPGSPDDGVTVQIPLAQLAQVSPAGFDWMVPGLLEDLCIATIRALPKRVRVHLVPAPDAGRAIATWLRVNTPAWDDMARAGDMAEPFAQAFSRAAMAVREADISPADVSAAALASHLQMRYLVVEPTGRGVAAIVDEDRSLLALQRRLATRAASAARATVRTALRAALEEAGASGASPASAASADSAARSGGSSAAAATGSPGSPGAATATPGVIDPARPAPGAREAKAVTATAGGHATTTPGAGSPGQGDSGHGTGPTQGTRHSEPGTAHGAASSPAAAAEIPAELLSTGPITSWPATVGELPEHIEVTAAGAVVRVHPGLTVGSDGSVRFQLFDDQRARDSSHAAGIVALIARQLALPQARVTTRWRAGDALTLAASPYPSTAALVADLHTAAVRSLLAEPGTVRSYDAFTAAVASVKARLEDEVYRIAVLAAQILQEQRALDAEVRRSTSLAVVAAVSEVRSQERALVYDGFVSKTPPQRLIHLPRYLRAATLRLKRAAADPHRDRAGAAQVAVAQQAFDQAQAAADAATAGVLDTATAQTLDNARWLIEELRVSVFAQQLGTNEKVSSQRIVKLLAPLG